jgi:hypothetical protein
MQYTDRELRNRISQDERLKLFSDVSQNAIEMTSTSKTVEVPDHLVRREINPDEPDPYVTTDFLIQQFGYPSDPTNLKGGIW